MALNLTARQKTAILMVSLPPDISAQIMREFDREQKEEISNEILKLPRISPEVSRAVIEDFYSSISNSSDIHGRKSLLGNVNFTEKFSGENTEDGLIADKRPLGFLRQLNPGDIWILIRKEHPQTMALILFYLDSSIAWRVIQYMPASLQIEVSRRLVDINKVAPDILEEIEVILEERMMTLMGGEFDYREVNGREMLVNILYESDHNTKEGILRSLNRRQPELAKDLRTKVCTFDDLKYIDNDGLKEVLRLVNTRDLVLALKTADKDILNRIYRCMKPESAKILREDIDNLPISSLDREEIEAAKLSIRHILRGLVNLEKIKLPGELNTSIWQD